jgi:hypothetical protein
MKRTILLVSAAALLAGTTYASAQVRDDPPGWAWQRRGILEDQGRNPQRFGYYGGYYDSYGAYGAYPYAGYRSYGYVPGPRYYRSWRDNPPGSRFEDRGVDEDMGFNFNTFRGGHN